MFLTFFTMRALRALRWLETPLNSVQLLTRTGS